MVYESYVRSAVEYAVISVFPMLKLGQRSKLESVQRAASRTILNTGYGPDRMKYDQRMSRLGLEELNKRWANQFQSFAEKIETEPRFSRFLKRNVASHKMDLRHRNIYEEHRSRTNRLQQSPVNAMIRHLNRQHAGPTDTI